MIQAALPQQAAFYREFLMGRGRIVLKEFGVDVTREEFDEQMLEEFDLHYRGLWTVDEMLLHPREAVRFCDDVRRKYGYFDCPDDIILRVIMAKRKNP